MRATGSPLVRISLLVVGLLSAGGVASAVKPSTLVTKTRAALGHLKGINGMRLTDEGRQRVGQFHAAVKDLALQTAINPQLARGPNERRLAAAIIAGEKALPKEPGDVPSIEASAKSLLKGLLVVKGGSPRDVAVIRGMQRTLAARNPMVKRVYELRQERARLNEMLNESYRELPEFRIVMGQRERLGSDKMFKEIDRIKRSFKRSHKAEYAREAKLGRDIRQLERTLAKEEPSFKQVEALGRVGTDSTNRAEDRAGEITGAQSSWATLATGGETP